MPVSERSASVGRRDGQRTHRPSLSPSSVPQSLSRSLPAEVSDEQTKLLLIPFRNGEVVARHPDVLPYLEEGWHVRSAAPRVTSEGTKLLVILE